MERKTRQREAIRNAMQNTSRPLGPQEILAATKGVVPDIGIATIYRALKELVAEGWLRKVELPGEPARYERSDLKHHHHFHCRTCGKVYDIDGCSGELSKLTPKGFRVETHEILLFGLCAQCARSA
ncbi:MAG: transcriptional repressor [Planctomycetota bacterium]|nr:transcriptional repressor [Planctomycetota bacterium]